MSILSRTCHSINNEVALVKTCEHLYSNRVVSLKLLRKANVNRQVKRTTCAHGEEQAIANSYPRQLFEISSRRGILKQSALASAALLFAPLQNAFAESQEVTSEAAGIVVADKVVETEEEGGTAVASSLVTDLTEEEKTILEYNQRIAVFNRAPQDFPSFIRNGYEVRVLTKAGYVEQNDGLIYKDYEKGSGPRPLEGQQVVFNYTAYNENGATIDSTYNKGRPAETRLGIGGMIPGFEAGIKGMRVGGKRRVVVPPELGPPVGPSTFFSSRQFEVFDVELLDISDCKRQGFGMISRVVCDSNYSP